MFRLPSSILVLLSTFLSVRLVSAQSTPSASYTLSDDVTNFMALCSDGGECLTSFVEANFPQNVCSSRPSLDCLCSQNSTSGYTIGEGAVQCIIAGVNSGLCQSASATADLQRAYNMCSGRSNALPNTHGTITATLVIQASGTSAPSILLVAAMATTTIGNGTPSSIPSTTSIPTANGPVIASASLGTSGTPTASGVTAGSSPGIGGLTAPQIAGVAGGVTVTILAIGGLILCGCLRRKKILAPDDDSDFGTFQEHHENSMEGMFRGQRENKQAPFTPGRMTNGVAARAPVGISKPLPVLTNSNMFSRRSIAMEEIGVAISPEIPQRADFIPASRQPSKLLPEKPALPKMHIVSEQSASELGRPYFNPPGVGDDQIDETADRRRESGVTEFEDQQMDVAADQRRDSGATQFEVDLPSPVEFSKSPSDSGNGDPLAYQNGDFNIPQYYQESIPRSRTAPVELAPRPIDIRKSQSHQSFSKTSKAHIPSNFYSGHRSLAPSDGDVPRNKQDSISYGPPSPYKSNNHQLPEPLTSIEPAAKAQPPALGIRTSDLSLVAESPSRKSPVGRSPVGRSPVGRSPVSYPKIKSRLSDHVVESMDSPRYPDFKSWPDAEIEAANIRAHKLRQPGEFNLYFEVDPHENRTQHNQGAPNLNNSSLLAQRRGNKFTPTLNLDKEAQGSKAAPKWRLVNQDSLENPISPITWQPLLTPQRIGEDLVLGVRKY